MGLVVVAEVVRKVEMAFPRGRLAVLCFKIGR
jgi:hypothetical protein